MQTINFGIDLGTTNSLIARFAGSNVEVFKNPIGFKETLPSCVAFRNERVIVGDKAREWLLKDPLNVFSAFKRKMGTDESYFVASKDNLSVSPIELSAMVLKELKNFVYSSEVPQSVVITIPASFDTVQSNATKQAGYEAGFAEVVLLQEPIAASLAFFNKHLLSDKQQGKWLVYDLGGGTFDVALIGIDGSEMKVLDHQGDNFLGGVDFDHDLVMQVIVPKLIQKTGNSALAEQIKLRNSIYEKLYYVLLLKAEEAKKELSSRPTTEIEFVYTDPNGQDQDIYLEISQAEFNAIIKDRINATLLMLEVILDRNALTNKDIEEIILIGGSTYIPFVRETIAQQTQIKVNTQADPSTAVVVGAAYFAGNKPISIKKEEKESPENANSLSIKTGYNTTTKDLEEYISAQVNNYSAGLFYRIVRADGGFDTGLKALSPTFGEFVMLLPNKINSFQIKIFDAQNNPVFIETDSINISHGLFSLYGQPLPEDICIEIDDLNNNSTRCDVIFARNSILPLTKTIYKEMSKTIRKGSGDSLIINLMEGDAKQHPSTNKVIGVIEIKAENLTSDLVRGSDIEIKIDISESRDVSVSTHLGMTDQQFEEVFSPTKRYVSIAKLQDEITELRGQLSLDLDKALQTEDYDMAAGIQENIDKARELYDKSKALNINALTDEKYQLDEAKRRLARQLYTTGPVNNRVIRIKEKYYSWIENLTYWLDEMQDIPQKYQDQIKDLKESETEAMRSNSYFAVEGHFQKTMKLVNKIIYYTPTLLVGYFHIYSSQPPESFDNYTKAKQDIERGEKALERQNYEELRSILMSLVGNTKNAEMIETKIKGTGLS